jgi:glycosyltransferase involved in cell wall biosynthesis
MSASAVSVVMPVYNVEAYVAEAIRSVLAQSFGDFELIIVDDGGNDASMAICRRIKDPRIRIISQPNRGLAGARNTGIAAARGRFVALLDADDRWAPEKLMLHVIHLDSNVHVDVSYAGSRLIDAEGDPMRIAMRPRLTGVEPAHILMRNPVGNGSAAVIRATALGRVMFAHPDEPDRRCWFDESFRQSEDIEMWLRMAMMHDCVFEGIAGLLTDYRIVRGGLSANIARQFESWQRVIDKVTGYAPALIARYGQRAAAYQLRYLARRAVQLGDGKLAMALLREAISRDPSILLAEPRKSLVTVAAAVALQHLPRDAFEGLSARFLGVRT